MKLFKKIGKGTIIVIISLITLFNIYNLINTKILNNDLTVVNSYAMLEVVSGSMEPTIKVGDLIFIDLDNNDYTIGDIVTYRDEYNSFVTHRIMYIEDDSYILKGDANNAIDKPISASQIVGKYVSKIDHVGNIIKSLRNPFTLIIILIFGIIICYILSVDEDEINQIEKELNNSEREENRKILDLPEVKKETVKKTKTSGTKNTTKKTKTNSTKKVESKKSNTKKVTKKNN